MDAILENRLINDHDFSMQWFLIIGGVVLEASPALTGLGGATVLYWGAKRTAQHRPQEVKDEIRASLAVQVKDPVKPWWMVKPSY